MPSLSQTEVQVLNALTSLSGLGLETGGFESELARTKAEEVANSLMERGILHLSYGPGYKLDSVVLLWMSNLGPNGDMEQLLSVADALIQYAYYGTVYAALPSAGYGEVFAVIRVPDQDTMFLSGEFRQMGIGQGFEMRVFEFVSRWNQTYHMHERIYNEATGWDSDISGVLAQFR